MVSIVSVASVSALSVLFAEQKNQVVGAAIQRAGAIAAAIETGRSLGVVTVFDGSLGDFLGDSAYSAEVAKYMPSVGDGFDSFGADVKDFYHVKVNQYSVTVSFSVVGSEFVDFDFPSTYKQEKKETIAGIEQDVVTWTTGPAFSHGINTTHMTTVYLNNEN